MNDLILYQEDLEKLNNILNQFIKDAQVVCAFLTNKEGQLLTCQGSTKSIDTMSVAALITGSFAATVTIANLIGESQFSTMFHKGRSKHIHIIVVDNDRYLASIFDNHSSVEKVNYYANRYGKKLREYLLIIGGNAESAVLPELSAEEIVSDQEEVQDSFESFLDAMASDKPDNTQQTLQQPEVNPKRVVNPPLLPPEEKQELPVAATPQTQQQAPAAHPVPSVNDTHEEKKQIIIPVPEYTSSGSDTAYLKLKIKEARSYHRHKPKQAFISRLFGKKN